MGLNFTTEDTLNLPGINCYNLPDTHCYTVNTPRFESHNKISRYQVSVYQASNYNENFCHSWCSSFWARLLKMQKSRW